MNRMILMAAMMCCINAPAHALSDAELAAMLAASAAAAAASGTPATPTLK